MCVATYGSWSRITDCKEVESKVVLRLCEKLCQYDNLAANELGLPESTVQFLMDHGIGRSNTHNAASVPETELEKECGTSPRLVVDLKYKPDRAHSLDHMKARIMAVVKKHLGDFESIGFFEGSLILRLKLPAEHLERLIAAAEAGAFTDANYESYRIVPEIPDADLSLKEKLLLLSQFARKVDSYHQQELVFENITFTEMYKCYVPAVVKYSADSPNTNEPEEVSTRGAMKHRSKAAVLLSTQRERTGDFIADSVAALGEMLASLLYADELNDPEDVKGVHGEEFRWIISAATVKDLHLRMPTARDFAEIIDACLDGTYLWSSFKIKERRLCLNAWHLGVALNSYRAGVLALLEFDREHNEADLDVRHLDLLKDWKRILTAIQRAYTDVLRLLFLLLEANTARSLGDSLLVNASTARSPVARLDFPFRKERAMQGHRPINGEFDLKHIEQTSAVIQQRLADQYGIESPRVSRLFSLAVNLVTDLKDNSLWGYWQSVFSGCGIPAEFCDGLLRQIAGIQVPFDHVMYKDAVNTSVVKYLRWCDMSMEKNGKGPTTEEKDWESVHEGTNLGGNLD